MKYALDNIRECLRTPCCPESRGESLCEFTARCQSRGGFHHICYFAEHRPNNRSYTIPDLCRKLGG